MGSAASSPEEKYAPSADEEADAVPGGDDDYDVSAAAAAAFLKAIRPVVDELPEDRRDGAEAALWAAAGQIYHDRDDEVAALDAELREARARAVALPNKFACASASTATARVVLVSSRVPDREDLVAAVRDQAWVLRYEWETATAESLAAAVAAKIEALGGAVDTIALVNHGPPEAGGAAWAIAKALEIPVDGAPFDAGAAAAPLLRAIAGAKGLRRVDLLACDIAATPNGVALVEQLEKALGVDVAASTDVTGNLRHGGDWTLETDDVDAAETYFEKGALVRWDGLLRAGLRNGFSKFLRRRREREKRGRRVRVRRGRPTGRFHHENHDPPSCAIQ